MSSSSPVTTLFKMPKTGSSSVEHLLQDRAEVAIILHDELQRARLALQQAEWTFTFVRNPFWRLVSAYNWVMHTRHKVDQVHENIFQQVSAWGSFDETVANLEQLCQSTDAIHFLPMHWWLCEHRTAAPDPRHLLVDYICRYENFEQDLAQVLELRQLRDLALERSSRQIFRSLIPRSQYADYYGSAETVARVVEFYRIDFELFDYPLDLPATE